MVKKILYFIFFVLLIFISYYLLSSKTGEGTDKNTKYTPVEKWPSLPDSLHLGNPTGIGIDTNQNIVVFHRADRAWPLFGSMSDKPIQHKTVLIIDRNYGSLINSWGENLFIMPHGLTVDHENNIWVTDVGLNQVFKFSYDGKLLLQLGEAKVSGNDHNHFNKPTDVAVAPDGSFYVSDGYGNSRVIKFSPDGTYLFEWGQKGDGESEFNTPHGICLDQSGNVYVADRENNRVQVFDSTGRFIKQLTGRSFGAICDVAFHDSKLYAVDYDLFLKVKHRGSDVMIFDSSNNVRSRFGRNGNYQGAVSWYHGVTADKDGNIYVGDILNNTLQKFKKVTE